MDYLPVFIANGYFRNKTDFQRQHVVFNRYNTRYPQITGYVGERQLMKLRDDILVGMSYEKHTVPNSKLIVSEYNKDIYDSVMKNRWNPFTNAPITEVAELCFVLRRIVNTDGDRTEKLKELLFRHPKAIIFYNYDYELECLRSLGYGPDTIVAEWNGHKHDAIPENKEWVYLVQYTAGAEGWNCVSTDTIIFYSQNYSYRAMVQAAGRIDRLNTPFSDLYYYHLKTKAPIDMAITRALKQKKNFNEKDFFERKR